MEVATATEVSAPAASGSAARKNHSFPWLDAAISEPYYFLHLLAFFSYFAARSAALAADDGGELHHCLLRRVSFRDPRVLDPDRVIWLVIKLCWLMRIGVGVFVFAGDPGSARVPRALRSEGAMVNANLNSCVNLFLKLFGDKISGSMS